MKRVQRGSTAPAATGASAGSVPAASLKRYARRRRPAAIAASAGSVPAASLKRGDRDWRPRKPPRIRGVCPRGLIEASTRCILKKAVKLASAGSVPAASLSGAGEHPRVPRPADEPRDGIRGVCPRGLIEAKASRRMASPATAASAGSVPAASLKRPHGGRRGPGRCRIRGVCPRGLIEARHGRQKGADMKRIRGVCPRGLIEACRCFRWPLHRCRASAGSVPAASLKLDGG